MNYGEMMYFDCDYRHSLTNASIMLVKLFSTGRLLIGNVSDYVQIDVFTSAKMPNTLKFLDKDVSKRPELLELRLKFEHWT